MSGHLRMVTPSTIPHIIVSYTDGAGYDGRAVLGTFSDPSEAQDEAKRLQRITPSMRYAVFALVGTSEPEAGAKFIKIRQ